MAKKSAASKGYRKYQPQKKEMSQKEQRNLLIAVGAFVLAIIVVLVALKINDGVGVMRVKDKIVQNVQEGDMLKNTQSQSKPRVYRMARVTEAVPGYTAVEFERSLNTFWVNTYKADDENAALPTYDLVIGTGEYDELVNDAYESMSKYSTIIEQTDVLAGEFGGKDCRYFQIVYASDNSEAQDGSDMHYYQYLYSYFDSKFDGYCVMAQTGKELASESEALPMEDLTALIEEVAQRFVVVDKHGK